MNKKSRKCKKIVKVKVRVVPKDCIIKNDTWNDNNKTESKSISVIKLPRLSKLEALVNETVIGQEDVVRAICTKVYEGILFPNIKSNILLVGKSGTGKTEIVRQIAKNLKFPLVIEDSTSFTQAGYVGRNVDEIIYDVIAEAKNNIELAQKAIVFIDEIDKKASRFSDSQSDISKGDVLKSLLKMIEGTVIMIENPNYYNNVENEKYLIKFDTSNLIFIFGGAFEGLDKLKEERLRAGKSIGFSSSSNNEKNHSNDYFNTSFTKEDLIEYGMSAEFVGRITNIYETNKLTEKDLTKILKKSKKSIFIEYEKVLNAANIVLEYPESLLVSIAKRAQKIPTGARELNSQVSYIFERIMYDAINIHKDYKKCVLEEGILLDNRKYHWES